ncbi:MAG: hypothetical protein P4L81_03350 [Candidatus Pacebacteria bacterium]|nr:hypothetical protein [Candidatus Paceibacterota bacterium]
MIEVVPTVVPNSPADIDAFFERSRGFARTFHVDAADGIFAPNVTWMPPAGIRFPESDEYFYEAHLMVEHPEAVGNAFVAAGAKRIIAHAMAFESEDEAKHAFDAWKSNGAKEVGIALLIDAPLETIEPFVLSCDCVTLMSIPRIGVQGIPFDERAYGRVADLHARYPELMIEVDGGIGVTQIATLARAGARRFAVGSALSHAEDPASVYKTLVSSAQSGL